jgi:hypothetical protein
MPGIFSQSHTAMRNTNPPLYKYRKIVDVFLTLGNTVPRRLGMPSQCAVCQVDRSFRWPELDFQSIGSLLP